jgi:LuxR family transcriptional regulator, maltose regulon positive regulatory protein
LCRHGAGQMRTDADETAHRFTALGTILPVIPLMQGVARVLTGDPDRGDAYFEDAVSIGEKGALPEVRAIARCERALLAMARGQWDRAETFAGQARDVLRTAGVEESFATPLVCAVRARVHVHRRNVPAARQELVRAQRLRPLLTYALPHVAVQARIELARAHLALADLAGARTLVREINDLLNRRPGLGTLVDEAAAVRDQLSKQRGSIMPRASSLTDAAPAAAAAHLSAFSGDRHSVAPLAAHHQGTGALDLPEAGGIHPEPGRHPGSGSRPARGVTARSFHPVREMAAAVAVDPAVT